MNSDNRHRVTRRVTLVGAGVNAGLACLQIVFGLLGKSQALLADGIHTLSDLATDFIVLLASGHAARDADEDHPYGHGRIETLASVLLGAMLLLVALGIGYRGVESIVHPQPTDLEAFTLLFAGLAIVAKEGLYHYTLRAARSIHSTLLESNAWHHRSDALSSIVVVIGIGAQLLGVLYADAIAAVVVALMIAWMAIKLVRKALSELIDTSLDTDLVESVQACMQLDPSVIGVHNLRSRSMGGMGYVDAHIEVDSDLTVSEAHYIAHRIEHQVKKQFPQIIDVHIHIDPLDDSIRDSVLARLPDRAEIMHDLEQAWQNIPQRESIEQVKLHYLDRLIEIDLILPATMCNAGDAGSVDKLREGAAELGYIGKVNVYYSE